MMLDVLFPVQGETIPTDHAYQLYSALSKIIPSFHEPGFPGRFAALNGTPASKGRLRFHEGSRLRVRIADHRIRDVLPLAGKRLELGADRIRLGVPHLATLTSAPTLFSRLVTIKNATTPEEFLESIRKSLQEKAIPGEPGLPLKTQGERAGETVRRVIRIHDKKVIGFALVVEGLSAEGSIKLQEEGIGGRTKMGCGFFLPMRSGR